MIGQTKVDAIDGVEPDSVIGAQVWVIKRTVTGVRAELKDPPKKPGRLRLVRGSFEGGKRR